MTDIKNYLLVIHQGLKFYFRFNAEIEYSNRDSISNFEKLDVICRKLQRTAILCNLSENHAKVLLQSYIEQPVVDAIGAYTKSEFLDLSYRKILETLQLMFCPLNLSLLESKIMSYTIEPGQSVFAFASKCYRHLTFVVKKLT